MIQAKPGDAYAGAIGDQHSTATDQPGRKSCIRRTNWESTETLLGILLESLEITWDCEQKLTSLVEQHAGIVITSRENMDTKLSMKSGRRENMDMKRLEYDKILVPKI